MERLAQRLSELDSDETVLRALEDVNQRLEEVEAELEASLDKEGRDVDLVLTRLETNRDLVSALGDCGYKINFLGDEPKEEREVVTVDTIDDQTVKIYIDGGEYIGDENGYR